MITFKRPDQLSALHVSSAPSTALERVLITGAENPLARLLAAQLHDSGLEVTVQAVAPDVQHKLKRSFTVVSHSVSDPRFAEAVRDVNPHVVLHMNAEPSNTASAHAPYAAFNRIVDKTVALCETLRREAPKSRLLLLSSSAIYGECAAPVNESATLNPKTIEGRCHRFAEEIARDFQTRYDLSLTILRVFSAYGPGLRANPVYDMLFTLLGPEHQSRLLSFDPRATRDVVHSGDVVQAVSRVLQSGEEGTYNVGSGSGITMADLAAQLGTMLELPQPSFTGTMPYAEPRHELADVSKLRALGFAPQVPLAEGLRGFTAWWSGLKAA